MPGLSRRELEERVDVLREHNDGKSFAAAVEQFSAELDDGERAELREILLERARDHARRNPALDERLERGGFFKRTLKRLDRDPFDR
jgi:hypothetical protein